MYTEIIQAFDLFNEKATKLSNISFMQKILKSGINISRDNFSNNKRVEIRNWGPDEESVDAFVLTYRFFINDKDDISFRKIDQLYGSLGKDFADYIERFKQIRNEVNNILDSFTVCKVNEHKITNREAQNIFLYGHLSHSNRNDLNTKRYNRIKNNPVFYSILWNSFTVTIAMIYQNILLTKELNEEVLKIIKTE